MKSSNKIFLGTLVCILLVMVTLQVQANRKIMNYEDVNKQLIATINLQEEKINTLILELDKANATIELQTPMVEGYMRLADFLDFDSLDTTQLEKAKEISDATPLEYESAIILVKYADIYDIPYSLVLSIIDIESGFQQNLVGADRDRGYMQIIPGTERWLAKTFGDELGLSYDPNRIFEPEYNLALGIKYLDELMSDYGVDYDRILSEYNRGPNNLKKYYEANRTYSTTYSRKVLSKNTSYVALNN